MELRKFKAPGGAINYNQLLAIPFNDRLPNLIGNVGYEKVHKLLGVSITLAFESMSLTKPVSAGQIFELVDTILDTCDEDYLGLEDVLLFLQKMVRGEAGSLFSSMDIAKFTQAFEKYRQERHSEYMKLKEEKEVQLKCTPSLPRISESMERTSDIDNKTFFSLMETFQSGKNDQPE